jgi:predicted phosphodiesterase
MKTAFISDIHGNWSALLTVLDDIKSRQVDRIICLGDMVDGGDHNNAVVEFIKDNNIITVQGNHDAFNDCRLKKENQGWLNQLPEIIIEDDIILTHISPRFKKNKISNNIEAWNVFDESNFRLHFIGHLHFPVLFGEKCEFFAESCEYPIDDGEIVLNSSDRYIICFGAVGYPRSGGKFIRYGIFNSIHNSIEFIKLEGFLLPYGFS